MLNPPSDRGLDQPTESVNTGSINTSSLELWDWSAKVHAKLIEVILKHERASLLHLQELAEVGCHLQNFKPNFKLVNFIMAQNFKYARNIWVNL